METYDPANLELVHHTNQALKANLIFKKDTDYIVRDGKVQIIDEFTEDIGWKKIFRWFVPPLRQKKMLI